MYHKIPAHIHWREAYNVSDASHIGIFYIYTITIIRMHILLYASQHVFLCHEKNKISIANIIKSINQNFQF